MEKDYNSEWIRDLFEEKSIDMYHQDAETLMRLNYPYVYEKQLSLSEMVRMSKESQEFGLLQEAFGTIHREYLYKSSVHGIRHIERTVLLAFWISLLDNSSESDIRLYLECARYHDIGRSSDGEDIFHGLIGSRIYEKHLISSTFNEEDNKIIAFGIASHCLNETYAKSLLTHYFEIDEVAFEKCKKMLYIIKDADALDRFRLSSFSLNVHYLNNPVSCRLIESAYQLYKYSQEYEL